MKNPSINQLNYVDNDSTETTNRRSGTDSHEMQIVDANTGNPIAGVNVFLENDPSTGAISNANGDVILLTPQGAPQTVVFSHVGYKNSKGETGSLGQMISLQPAITTLDPTIITGDKNVIPVLIGVAGLFLFSFLATKKKKVKKPKTPKTQTLPV